MHYEDLLSGLFSLNLKQLPYTNLIQSTDRTPGGSRRALFQSLLLNFSTAPDSVVDVFIFSPLITGSVMNRERAEKKNLPIMLR